MPQSPDNSLLNRIAWRLMPLLVASFLIAFVDRQNVGFAKLTMLAGTGMTEAAYGLGASLFFIGYLVFEIPSSLALHRFGARRWIARIMLTWGLANVLLMYAKNAPTFSALRFLLGAAEAGFYPGVIVYLGLWFPAAYRTRVLGIFTLGSALGNMLGALTGGLLLSLNGVLGLAGWQWVFLGTGLPAMALAAIVFIWLPALPAEAGFLTPEEKLALAAELAREAAARPAETGHPLACLSDPRVYGFALLYMLMSTAQYGVTYWMPTVVKGFGVGPAINGLLTMIPWALAATALLLVPSRLKGDRSVFRAVASIGVFGTLAFTASILPLPPGWRFLALCLGGPCISLMYPCFWTFPSRCFSGARAAAGIAAINSIGNLGGFLAQNLMPHVQVWTGSVTGPMIVPAACQAGLAAAALIALLRLRPPVALLASTP